MGGLVRHYEDFEVVHWASFTQLRKDGLPVRAQPTEVAMCYTRAEPFTAFFLFSPAMVWELSREAIGVARWNRVGGDCAVVYPLRGTARRPATKMIFELLGMDVETRQPSTSVLTVNIAEINTYLRLAYDLVPPGSESGYLEPVLDSLISRILDEEGAK